MPNASDEDNRNFTRRASFEEYRLLIINELERIAQDLKDTNAKIDQFRREDVAQMKTDIAVLKFQAFLYGSIAGMVATALLTVAIKFTHG